MLELWFFPQPKGTFHSRTGATILFRTTVAENIAYGKPGATRQEVIRAARLANAHEFIERMPQGYDMVIGERGDTLSGGQRQREPSTGLDAASEQLVFEALERLMKGKTAIVIAHRLATVRKADVIYVLEHGRIAEAGKHQELLARGGLYSQLYDIQFKNQEVEPLNR